MESPHYNRKLVFLLILIFSVVMFIMWLSLSFLDSFDRTTKNSSVIKKCHHDKGPFPLPEKIPKFTWHDTGLVTLWFDDAWFSQFSTAAPIMEKMGIPGTVSVAVNFICNPVFMTWNELRILQSKGWETTSHSITHNCDLQYYNPETIAYELGYSKQLLESHGLRADHFVMPCGYSRFNILFYTKGSPSYPHIVETAPKYYASYRTTDGDHINPLPVLNRYNLKAFEVRHDMTDEQIKTLMQTTVAKKGWLILVFHQIDKSDEKFAINEKRFREILTIVKSYNLPIVLPTQALSI